MKVLLVTPYYIPAWGFGGPVKVVSDLALALNQLGHHVTVATTDILDKDQRISKHTDIIDGIPVYYFRNRSTVAAFRWNLYSPRGFSKWLGEHVTEFDVIHCHDFYTSLNVTVSRVAKHAGVPYLLQPHGALIPIRKSARFSWLKQAWLTIHARVLRDAAKVIASTTIEQQEIHDFQGVDFSRIACIPNGLSNASIGHPVSNPTERKQLGINPNEHIILYFGRIQHIKGIDISLRSLALLKDPPWKFIIVGRDDGQKVILEKLAEELGISQRVIFVGQKFGQALDKLIGISDVFLFNSRSESFPVAVLNACAAGLPVVLSRECRVPEVEDFGAGVVLVQNTPKCTAETLQPLLSDVPRRTFMGEAGQRLVREKFSLELIVKQYVGLYRAVQGKT